MREPAFWWQPPGLRAGLLAPVAAVYGAIAARRMAQSGHAAGIPVICVGNLTVGGAGKTPTAMAVAQVLIGAGRKPFFLTRGYGGRLPGPLRVDPGSQRAGDVGDEPLLLARVAPTIVSRDRVSGAELAHASGADTIVMDDGFQNPSLAKNLSIVVIDGARGVGNGVVIPAGPLRAPFQAQLDHEHALLVIGTPVGALPVLAPASTRKLPVLHGRLEPDADTVALLRQRPVLAFAGIGDPDKFFATLTAAGIDVRAKQSFPDHHRYHRIEAADLLARAEREGLVLSTTEKDWIRLSGQDDLKALAAVARPLPVKLVVDEAETFRDLVLRRPG